MAHRYILLNFFVFLPLVTASVHEIWWNITYVQNINPDGLFPRRVIGVNNSWPPPPIEVTTDDLLVVHAFNSLDKPTTLHHHGMFFNSTSWYDGAQGVSQCGIPPGQSFTYQVPINSSGQWGTYWVHAHSGGQYTDGLRAPVVIHPPTEVHAYDEEFTVVISDWYHQEQAVLLQHFLSIADPGGAEPIPDAALIYFSQNGTYLPGYNQNASLPFSPGKTYRLRIINQSAFAMFYFWIDGHQMRVIEADGTDLQESPVDSLSITVAQRYSVLVTARNDTSQNWAIHANMDYTMFDTVPPQLNPNATANIVYNSSASLTDLGFVDVYNDTDDISFVPVPAIPQLPPATHQLPLLVSFDTMTDGTNRASFNNVTYNTPIVPGVFSALSLGTSVGPNAELTQSAYGPWSYVLNKGDVVDIELMNSDTGKHPFHIHGHKVQIVKRSQDYTSDDPSLNAPLVEGQANPMRRDTVEVPGGEGATLRFVADNPGVWFFHCHIEWHLEAGLAITLISAPDIMESNAAQNPTLYKPPQYMFDQCATLGLPTTGNAAGLNSTTDLTGLTIGPFLQNNGWHSKGIAAMAGCVLTAVIGMATVTWYALGEHMSDEEVEEWVVRKQVEKEGRKAKGILGRLRLK